MTEEPEGPSLRQRLSALHERGVAFFNSVSAVVDPLRGDVGLRFSDLPPEVQVQADELGKDYFAIADLLVAGIRRSPLLTDADGVSAGRALKGIRAALHFRRYRFWDATPIADEEHVLDVAPAGESQEWTVSADEASDLFENWSDELIRRAELSVFDTSGNETESPIKLFISHASEDRDLAAALVELLVFALKLPAATVRCTSVDGYGLPGGARTDEVLRAEVHDAPAFVGIVSQNSARSVYVLFELGARWGAGRHLLPILAPGTHVSVLGGPLANLNALKADNRAQLSRLVTEIARRLGIVPDDPAAYQTHINRIIAIKQTDSWPKQEVAQEAPSTPQLAPRNAAISAYGASPADDGISDLELDMADLFGPLRSALAQHKFIREFFALPNRAVMIGGSSIPRLRFNADQIPDLMTKLGILEERGLVRDVSKYANAPIYRMSDRLVRLLIGS